MSDTKMTFWEHLGELRKRFIYCFLAVIAGTIVAFSFSEEIWRFLIQPLPEKYRHLNYTGLAEPFFTSLKLAFFAGIFFTAPFLLWQTWLFVSPALYAKEKHVAIPFVALSLLLFVGGTGFCYYVVLPAGYGFLVQFMPPEVASPILTLREYLSLSTMLILAFGFTFELPLFIFFLNRLGVLPSARLKRFRRYWLVIAFILAAILTPGPDAISQILLAIPMIVLYEAGLWASVVAEKKRAAEAETAPEVVDASGGTNDSTDNPMS